MPRQRNASLVHEGGMRFVATTGTTRTIVYGDEIERGELSPVETLMVSLAACSGMDVWPIATKKRQVVSRYEIRIEAVQRDEYPQVLTRVDVTHVVEASTVGHDLTRGTASFIKSVRPERVDTEEETNSVLKEVLHEQPEDLPQLDSFGRQREPGRVA